MIRFGVIGTNWITDRFIEAARLHPSFQLSAVYSRTSERAAEFAAQHQILHTFTNIKEMADSGVIDAVYIASPTSCHAEGAIVAMSCGIHVLCEKPIASNRRELQEMIEAARQNGTLLMEAMKSLSMPGFAAIREHIGRIGKVRRYFANFCQYSSRYDAYRNGIVMNAFKPELSNGSLMDIGIYCIYPAIALFGKPRSIQAAGFMLESGVDGSGSLLLQYEGMDAIMTYSKVTNSALSCEIAGEDGQLVIDKISQPIDIRLQLRNGDSEDLTRPTLEQTMFYELDHFIGLLQEGKTESERHSFDLSLAVMEVLDEARSLLGIRYPADLG